jgi:hypothetical protein
MRDLSAYHYGCIMSFVVPARQCLMCKRLLLISVSVAVINPGMFASSFLSETTIFLLDKPCRQLEFQLIMCRWSYAGVLGRCWTLGTWSCTSSLRTSEITMTWKVSTAQPRRYHCRSLQSSAHLLTGPANCASLDLHLDLRN